jgi:hypothetical protein
MTNVDMTHVPYRGGGPAITDLLGDHVQVSFGSFSLGIEHINADLSACSAASRPRLDGREHDGTLVRHGSVLAICHLQKLLRCVRIYPPRSQRRRVTVVRSQGGMTLSDAEAPAIAAAGPGFVRAEIFSAPG